MVDDAPNVPGAAASLPTGTLRNSPRARWHRSGYAHGYCADLFYRISIRQRARHLASRARETSGELNMADDSWKNRTMIIGGVLGTLIGIGAAMMYIRAEEESLEVKRNTLAQHKAVPLAAVLPIAIAVLGVLRQISGLADRD